MKAISKPKTFFLAHSVFVRTGRLFVWFGLLFLSCSPEERQPEIEQTCYTMVEVTELPCLTDNQETGVIVIYESEDGQEYTRCFYPPEQAVNNLGSTICLSE